MRLEIHVHTKFSHDSLLSFGALYARCRRRGIDYIAVTEHNNIAGAAEFQKYCRERGDKIKVIVGEEIMTSRGEVIGLFLKSPIEPMMPPGETIDAIKAQGGIVYVPHPYDEKRAKTVLSEDAVKENAHKIDCIECHNGRNVRGEFSEKQNSIAEKYGLTKVVGSDAHTAFEAGRNYMNVKIAPDSPAAFIEAVRGAELVKKPCLRFCHHITRAARAVKLLAGGNYHELYGIIRRKLGK